jgi:hypothetical protein
VRDFNHKCEENDGFDEGFVFWDFGSFLKKL